MTQPQAIVEPKPKRSWAQLVPLIVLAALAWLLYRNVSEQGVPITIEFQAGRGIRVGDSVRYLGIDIGTIEEVEISATGDSVIVRAELEHSAADLARRGTQFWVVRPRVSFSGLAGLDTLVGSRYIDTLPGPTGSGSVNAFVGLDEPPIQVPDGALEVTLIANHMGGLTPGSPVLWKKIEVGRVLSVGLSSDARKIQGRIAIDPQYSALVLTTTRFFLNTGLNLDVGLSGMKLEVDSLKSLFTGGVAFATPEEPAAPARMGQRFDLVDEPKEEWLAWQPALQIQQDSDAQSLQRPSPTKALLSYKAGLLSRTRKHDGWTLWTERGLVGPAIVLNVPEDGAESASLEVSGSVFTPNVSDVEDGLAMIADIGPVYSAGRPWATAQCRNLEVPEDCLIFGDPNVTAIAVDASAIDGETWEILETVPLSDEWQGAAVISRVDGALVGLALVGNSGARIAPLPAALFD